ncbi:MAG TPA: methyl-accepting chemotaxis protein, partial [Thiobacillus sp.]
MMSRPLAHVEHVMRALAVGDLTQPVDTAGAGQDEIGCTLRAIDTMVTRLRELIGRIGESSCKVSNVAQAVSQSAAEVESGSRDFDRSISRIRAQTEQLHDTTRMASTQIEDANRHAGEATAASQVSSDRILQSVHNFEQFRREMETTAGKSRELESITDQITGIIQTIGGISRQTNLLALNAAIEAARAGEQGRGFAVVADEVRTLAGHTSKAVDEISGLIGSINNSVHETVASMEKALADATSNIDQLQAAADGTRTSSEQIKAISQSMHELVGLVETQNHSAGSIAEAAEQLSGISGSNRVQSQELHLRSDNLRAAAGELEDVVSLFKV